CLSHLRDLHSFPTRRSSDLSPPGRIGPSRSKYRCMARCLVDRVWSPRSGPLATRDRHLGRTPGWPGPTREITPGLTVAISSPRSDRKSTRLNSSHVKISYAV